MNVKMLNVFRFFLLPLVLMSGCTQPDAADAPGVPGVPDDVRAAAISDSAITITWNPPASAVGIAGYVINRNDGFTATSQATEYYDTGLAAQTTYSYTVAAVDQQGNNSIASDPATATTLFGATVYLPQTGQTVSYSAGDDGDFRAGIAWPEPRFTNEDGSTPISGDAVLDRLTGLMWTRDAGIPGPDACSPGVLKTWSEAFDYITCLNHQAYLGYTDWRMPNRNELKTLVNYAEPDMSAWLTEQGFTNVHADYYWTSTTYAKDTTNAWYVHTLVGWVINSEKTNTIYVWPVRAGTGQYMARISLPATGQTVSYADGDDGSAPLGEAWPEPRFTDPDGGYPVSGDVVLDQLTGLMWTKDGNEPGPEACAPGIWKTWREALDYVTCLNTAGHLGYSDWRLPNVNELGSLVHAGEADTATWLNDQGFKGVQGGEYWTSTDFVANQSYAWRIHLIMGILDDGTESVQYYVWPVRGGY